MARAIHEHGIDGQNGANSIDGIDGHDNGFGQPSGFAPREDLQGSQIVILEGLPR